MYKLNASSKNGLFYARLLNVVGLAVAFAAFYVIMVQVWHDLSYNRSIKDSDRVFAMSYPSWTIDGKWSRSWCRPIGEALLSRISSVESGGCCYTNGEYVDVYTGEAFDKQITGRESYYTPGALEALGFEEVAGSFKDMVTKFDWSVSESFARRAGLEIGSLFKIPSYARSACRVVAIYRDMPSNSDMSLCDMFYNLGNENIGSSSEWSYPYIVKLNSATQKESFEAQAKKIIMEMAGSDDGENDKLEIKLFPIGEWYLDSTFITAGESGDRMTTYTLIVIAILVILIAFVNYVNFYFSLIPVKIREVNLRKILGSTRTWLVLRMLMESVRLIVAAILVGGLIVYIADISFLGELVSTDIAFGSNMHIVAVTVAAGILLTVVSTLYPAFYITSFSPALAIKGGFAHMKQGKSFRYVLLGLQFVISISLIVAALFVWLQNSYMKGYNMGFDGENVLYVPLTAKVGSSEETVSAILRSNPQIADVTWSDGSIVASGRMGWGRSFKGKQVHFNSYPVSHNFLQFFGLKVYSGRDFTPADEKSESGVFIFNRKAQEEIGLTLEDRLNGHKGETEIAGFVENFNFKKLKYSIEPLCLYSFGAHGWRPMNTLYVRTTANADIPSVFDFIRKTVIEYDKTLTAGNVSIQFLNADIEGRYREEDRVAKLVSLFTLVAIMLSLMGVFGLAMFEAEFRRREIALRRVNGATVESILIMFGVKFIKILAICCVVSLPLSIYAVGRYLDTFAYRIGMHFWVFAVSYMAVFAVTLIIVVLRCYRAATENPVDVLRNE